MNYARGPFRMLSGIFVLGLCLWVGVQAFAGAPSGNELLSAVKAGDAAKVQALVAQGADVNAKDENGATALMWAAYGGSLGLMKALIAKGADPKKKGILWMDEKQNGWYGNLLGIAANREDLPMLTYLLDDLHLPVDDPELDQEGKENGDTALTYAAGKGNLEEIQSLLKHGANMNYRSAYSGYSPLMAAASQPKPEALQALLAVGADVKAKDKDGWTALHYAALTQPTAIGALLKAGADVNALSSDENGRVTPLMVACWNDAKDSQASVNALLAAGADVKAKDNNGWTALHYAVRDQPAAIGALLMKVGADVNAPSSDEYGRYTPLHVACWEKAKDSAASVKALLEAGAGVNTKDSNGRTALMWAARNGHKDVCEMLLAHRADLNTKESAGETALMRAAESGHKDVCELLIANGADVNVKNVRGVTALMLSAKQGCKDICGLLIAKGASLSAVTDAGETLLMCAAEGGLIELGALLISKGADVNAKDEDGFTALMRAAESGHKDTCELLIAKGADVNAKDSDGGTAIIAAAVGGHRDVVKFLLARGAAPLGDKTCQAMAMSAIKDLGRACQSYAADYGHAPTPEGGCNLVPIATFKGTLSPDYIQTIPAYDPWGHPYMYLCWDSGTHFAIISYGEDESPDQPNEEEYIRALLETKQKPITTACYQSDIIWLNDALAVCPEGEQKDCKKSNAN